MRTSSLNPLRYSAYGLAFLSVLSCGGGDGDGGGGPSPSFSVGAPATVSVQAGSSASAQITVTRSGNFSDVVTLTLEDAPQGLTPSFSPSVVPGSGNGSTLVLEVAGSVPAGTYTIKVCGNATGFNERFVLISLTVTPAPTGGFSLTVDPAALSVEQGQSKTATVTIGRTAPFTGSVGLAVQGAPAGVTTAFDPADIGPGGTTSTLTVSVPAATPAGTYTLTIAGTGTGVTEQQTPLVLTVTLYPGNFSLALSTGAVSVEQGKSATAGIAITPTAPFTGPVNLSLAGAPAGVTPTFEPAAIPGGATTSTLTLSAALDAPPGVYPLTVLATGSGVPDQTAPLTLTVTVAPGFTLQAAGAGVQQGQVGAAGVNVYRRGGFAGPVHLALVEVLPAGVTATLNPATVPPGPDGPSSAIVFSVLATAPVGSYPLTLRGTAAGVPDFSIQIHLDVRAAPGGNVTFTFCSPSETPIWFGYHNGDVDGSGSLQWTQVAGTGGVFNFPITSSKGGVAWVTSWTDEPGYYVGMFLGTQAELIELGSIWCQHTPPRKSHTGSVANVGSAEWYNVAIGDAAVEMTTGNLASYVLNDVPVGTFDLVAAKTPIPIGALSSTMIIRRGINYPAGGVIPLLDFGAAEAFLTTTKTATLENYGAEEVTFRQGYVTAGGTIGVLAHRHPTTATTPYMVVPPAFAQAGDLYNVELETSTTVDGPANRMVVKSFDVPNDQTLTLGPTLKLPDVFQLQAAPLYQVRVVSAWQPEYASMWTGKYLQNTRDGEFYVTSGYLGGGPIDVTTPDLRSVPGWNANWGPIAGVTTVLRGVGYGWTGATGALFPGFMGDFLTSPNITVRTATLYKATVP
jgi:hypothetical protein